MRKWIFLTLFVLLLGMLSPAAYGANVTIHPEETAYITVSLEGSYQADSIAVTFTFDESLLEPLYSSCTWARKGTLEDFGTHKNSGVWAVMDPTELGGEICTLAFRVRKDQADFNTAVSCRVILKNDDAFVADQTVQTRLTVLEASKQTQPQVTGPVFPSPATQAEADHDHDHDHDHEQTVDPDSILSAGERAGNVAVFFVTVGLLGLGAALAMKKKRRR